jgi:hypothetical protein
LLAFAVLGAACSAGATNDTTTIATGDAPTSTTARAAVHHQDPVADCRSSFGEGPVICGPGTDITSVRVDSAGPIILTIELSEPPQYDDDFQWLVEFSISDLACGLTNTSTMDEGVVGSDLLGPYGYRLLTNETAPPGTCDGSLDGNVATIRFNIQPLQGPWVIAGGTQRVEIDNLGDDGSSDDVAIDMTP